MPAITDPPPQPVQADLDQLVAALDAAVPAKRLEQNLLIATWNIRSFGGLTEKWTATGNDSPKRDLRGLRAICEVISRFDVVALQEVVGDLRALRHMMRFLGRDWGFLMTDVTLGEDGNNERMAFVFDRRRVVPSGLACELVVPPEWLNSLSQASLKRQFVRTPYAVSFRAQDQTFILVTLHVDWESAPGGRKVELLGIAEWMAAWARRTNKWDHNLIALGDFNIERKGNDLWDACTSTGLTVPQKLHEVPRTIFADPSKPTLDKYHDQIAWFESASGIKRLSMDLLDAGGFDFLPYVYTDTSLSKSSISYRVSDHYPLWTEFSLRDGP